MRIAILGTRGVPNFHGGFEQFAEYFSEYMARKGHEVFVYNSHDHPYQDAEWNGVNIVHCFDPEYRFGTAGQFIYDWNCISDSRKRDFDLILQLGYTSSSIWGKFLPDKPVIVTNMDGLEWKRSKYSKAVRKFLRLAEKWAVKSSDFLIADSVGIQDYLSGTYRVDSYFIPYGANIFNNPQEGRLKEYNLRPYAYNMLVARLEPENNIEVILDGVALSKRSEEFLVVGKTATKYGSYLSEKFRENKNIRFLGGIYDQELLNNLRYYSNLYFHGHSVGGTNPSLLEAMASEALIVAHQNVFNRSILTDEAFYFKNAIEVSEVLRHRKKDHMELVKYNLLKVEQHYSWERINSQYESFLNSCLQKR